MKKYEISKDWIKENGDKIKEAYISALVHKLDISSKVDMLKLLQIIDPKNAEESNAEIFSKILKLYKQLIKRKFEKKSKIKSKVVN